MKGGYDIEIKVIGSDNHNGIKLVKNIKKINCDVDINIKELNDEASLRKYNVKNTPAIIIDGKIVSQGKVLSTRDICRLLTSY